ncbi:hypothetical protein GBAR_LOCUS11663 [Geodia barretti]|uniref:Uncharacterized protein n=1 Tax=Geodia barretti TaxID=519541 RepID=A0AA35WG88_GEOBA|nr:hypothetical protein GBAR_LOCUS11663 [Geodia barretti]
MPDTEQVGTTTNRDTTNTAEVTTVAAIATSASVVGVTLSVVCIVVLLFVLKKRKRKEGDRAGYELATTSPLPEVSSPPPPPVDLVHQLQEELHTKNMLYEKQHIHLSKVIGQVSSEDDRMTWKGVG